jgi:hypothetical protein
VTSTRRPWWGLVGVGCIAVVSGMGAALSDRPWVLIVPVLLAVVSGTGWRLGGIVGRVTTFAAWLKVLVFAVVASASIGRFCLPGLIALGVDRRVRRRERPMPDGV